VERLRGRGEFEQEEAEGAEALGQVRRKEVLLEGLCSLCVLL